MKKLFVCLALALSLSGCGDGSAISLGIVVSSDSGPHFQGTDVYRFQATIFQDTFRFTRTFTLYNSFAVRRENGYRIGSQTELDAFNRTLDASEQLALDNLSAFTYFLIREPACPDFYRFAGTRYEADTLAIFLDYFTDDRTHCSAVVSETFAVYRAQKR